MSIIAAVDCITVHLVFFYNKSYSIILHVQYRPEGLQHLHARKIRVMWLFYTCVTCNLRANYAHVKNYTNFYTHSNYTQIAWILMEAEIYSYSYTHSAYHVYGATKSDLKLSELKLPFGVFNNRYTCSFHNKFQFVIAGTGVITMSAVRGA